MYGVGRGQMRTGRVLGGYFSFILECKMSRKATARETGKQHIQCLVCSPRGCVLGHTCADGPCRKMAFLKPQASHIFGR
jgi:hypothetical protein